MQTPAVSTVRNPPVTCRRLPQGHGQTGLKITLSCLPQRPRLPRLPRTPARRRERGDGHPLGAVCCECAGQRRRRDRHRPAAANDPAGQREPGAGAAQTRAGVPPPPAPRGGARPHHGGGNYVRLFGKSYKWLVTTASAGAGNRGRQSSTWVAAWPRAAGPASGRLSHFTNNRLSKRVSSCGYSDKSPQTSSLKQRNLSSPRPGRRRRGVPTSSMSRDTADERGDVHRRLPSPGKPGSQSRGRRGAAGVSGALASSRPPPPRRPCCSRRWIPRHSRPTFCSSRLPLRAPRDSVGAAPHRGAVCRGPSGCCRGSAVPGLRPRDAGGTLSLVGHQTCLQTWGPRSTSGGERLTRTDTRR